MTSPYQGAFAYLKPRPFLSAPYVVSSDWTRPQLTEEAPKCLVAEPSSVLGAKKEDSENVGDEVPLQGTEICVTSAPKLDKGTMREVDSENLRPIALPPLPLKKQSGSMSKDSSGSAATTCRSARSSGGRYGHVESKISPDETAKYLERKRQRESLRLAMEQEREARELAECTFKPQVDHRHRRYY